ncbi:MAG: hypothetical protein ACREH9_13645, partial [Pseudomonadota bacterium]
HPRSRVFSAERRWPTLPPLKRARVGPQAGIVAITPSEPSGRAWAFACRATRLTARAQRSGLQMEGCFNG